MGSAFFMPGRSSPRMATTRLGAGLGAATGAGAAAASPSAPEPVAGSGDASPATGCEPSAGGGVPAVGVSPSIPASLACVLAASSAFATASAALACPRNAASNAATAERIFWASPVALAASSALDASSTVRSCSLSCVAAFSRSSLLRLNASSIGLRKASHSFCSCLRSSGTACASACQRCCNAFTASMRSWGWAPSSRASSIIAWRRSRLCFCSASSGAAAAWIASFHKGCNSANAFSLRWPASRQRSANW